jgi:hypothetical protein
LDLDSDLLKLCQCGCGIQINTHDKKGRPRFYVNGHNRRRPRILRKYQGIAKNIEPAKMEEIIEIHASLLEKFIGSNTTLPHYLLILQQQKYIKDLEKENSEYISKNLQLRYLIRNIFSQYILMDKMTLEDEKKIVELVGSAIRGSIVSEERFDCLYASNVQS